MGRTVPERNDIQVASKNSDAAGEPPEDLSFGLPVPTVRAQAFAMWGVVVALLGLSLPLHLVDIDRVAQLDTISFWMGRTDRFWAAIEKQDWSGTFLSPHPGAPLMWLSGASMKLHGVTGPSVTAENLGPFYLPVALMNAVVPSLVFLASAKYLGRSGFWIAVALGGLWITEPIMVAFGRLSYMDPPFACWSALALWLCTIALRTRHFRWSVLAGASMGVAVATRIQPGCAVLFGIGLWFAVPFARSRARDTRLLALLVVLGVTALSVVALLWPTLLVDPIHTVTKLVSTTEKTVGAGYGTYFMGRTSLVGNDYYAATFLFFTSYAVFWCSLVGIVVAAKNATLRFLCLGFSLSFAPYLGAILWSSKKHERYLIELYPILLFLAALGLAWIAGVLARRLSRRVRALRWIVAGLAVVLVAARAARIAHYNPNLAGWCADYPGLRCDDYLAFRPFIGLRDVGEWIAARGKRRPSVYITYSSRHKMIPWLDYRKARKPGEADYIVAINSSLVRGFKNRYVQQLMTKREPDYRFVLGGREYVSVYENKQRKNKQRVRRPVDLKRPGSPLPRTGGRDRPDGER